ncbi:ornithine cyclodeaminase family protein [Rhizobium grahamii]|uniref:Ornithine cyclodeaminase/mu-crystallin n=2 Tax=Rhizobium grahamii TaxID=1120045 RepID=S3HC67_9HYPH|nr:ornithine cyclodeaminase family protein [Rhizobium grahamii]EPE96312.1 ornithine cyclodeaminase/mu-crystallin [Rhizobium grahamii CCGE 502]RDJ02905.1 ornithine cyclodeaminase [Rhizobium grahamii]
MRHFDAETVHRALDYPSTVGALRFAHAQGMMPQLNVSVFDDDQRDENKFISLFSWASGDVIAVKMVGVFPGNPALTPPQPSVQGLVALFDGRTGEALATCDGAALTFRKTAADSALGVDCLARADCEVLLVVGAGGLAPHVVEAHTSVRPSIREVLVWNRNPTKAEDLADRLRRQGKKASAAVELDKAVARADIVSCVTMATEPLIRGELLKPGTHVDLIGAYSPEMREADDETLRRAGRLFVDTRNNCDGSGDVAGPLAAGIISHETIVADLFDLCGGKHEGRRTRDEITVYKNVGGGHLDMFTARHLLARLT